MNPVTICSMNIKFEGGETIYEKNNHSPDDVLTTEDERVQLTRFITHPETAEWSPEILAAMMKDVNIELRRFVTQNLSIPSEVLIELAEDKDFWVRTNVARNPNTPPEILTQLAEDENTSVTSAVASNPNIATEIVIKLTTHLSRHTVFAATQNPVFLQHRAEQDGMCEVGQQMPVEWLKQMYPTPTSE